jgi:hypothetical protein
MYANSSISRSHHEEGSRGEVQHILPLLRSFRARSQMSTWKIFLVTSFLCRINNPVVSGRYCFDVWDGSGNKDELGCTKDSLQSYHDSDNDQFDYSFDLDKVTASNEGSGTNNRTMTITYLQDVESENGHTSARDAAPQQIVYRTTTNGNTTPAGTLDFFYNGPSNSTTKWHAVRDTVYQCVRKYL